MDIISKQPIRIRLLQFFIFIAALVPIIAGARGIIVGADIFADERVTYTLNSHIRYLSGILMAIGLCFWSFIPKIETKGLQVKTLTILVVIGGLARLYGFLFLNETSQSVIIALIMELIIVPFVCFWQHRVAI